MTCLKYLIYLSETPADANLEILDFTLFKLQLVKSLVIVTYFFETEMRNAVIISY